jgi:serine/threonine protein kinase
MSQNTPSMEAGATLRAAVAELPGPQLEDLVRLDRYEAGPIIGKGGMGEVRQCHDVRLSRHIALKTATTRNKAELSRFVREAQVQGQLEHPSIVPVYELGVGGDGAPYFAMKRVLGATLFDVVDALGRGVPEAMAKWPRRKLLGAFLQVCQAVDFAHTRGWIHRDLKPANVMLGDFGEVYVLDWGLARRHHERDEIIGEVIGPTPVGLTTPGQMMGTPGYMAPEQVNSQPADIRSDVYALGAILFEVLTLQMLAKGNTTMELLLSTRDGCDARARVRAPDAEVPPELEAVCLKATAKDPTQRFASVRELHDAIDRVLAGERDLELRATLARAHADAAKKSYALAQSEPDRELEHRQNALRELGLSLALDQTYRPAAATLIELIQHPPTQTPPEAKDELDRTLAAQIRPSARSSAVAYLIVALLEVPMMFHMGRFSPLLALTGLFFIGAAIAAGSVGWAKRNRTTTGLIAPLVLSNVGIALMYYFDGPLTLVPMFAAVNTVAFALSMDRGSRRLAVGLGVLTASAPMLGSFTGVLPETFRFIDDGRLLLLPLEVPFAPNVTLPLFLFCYVGLIVAASLIVGRVRDTIRQLERKRAMQMWNLRQLLPPEATPGMQDESLSPDTNCMVTKMIR